MTAALAQHTLTRLAVEEFLYFESDLLDRWELEQWYQLFEPDGRYEIVTPGLPDGETASADDTLLLVSDDMDRLDQRVRRILKKSAHVEYPRSQTSHMLSNVRVVEERDDEISVRVRFLTFRTKADRSVQFFGHQLYRLVRGGDSFRIRTKRTILDFDSLADQGKVTIIL